MKLIITPKAEKQFVKLPKIEGKKVIKKLDLLIREPFVGKKLSGDLEGYFSVRSWPYRIIYHINKSKRVIWIDSIVHRQGAYD